MARIEMANSRGARFSVSASQRPGDRPAAQQSIRLAADDLEGSQARIGGISDAAAVGRDLT